MTRALPQGVGGPCAGWGALRPLTPLSGPCGSPRAWPAARRARDPAAQASCTLRWPEGVTSPSLLLPTMQGERGGVGWAAERAHPQGGISPRVPISTTPGPDVQSTPHGGRGGPKVRPLALRTQSLRVAAARCTIPPTPGRWGQAPADPQRGWGSTACHPGGSMGPPSLPACLPCLPPPWSCNCKGK